MTYNVNINYNTVRVDTDIRRLQELMAVRWSYRKLRTADEQIFKLELAIVRNNNFKKILQDDRRERSSNLI